MKRGKNESFSLLRPTCLKYEPKAQIPLHGPEQTLSETRVTTQSPTKFCWVARVSDKSADFVWS